MGIVRDMPDNYVRGDNNYDMYEVPITVLVANNTWGGSANVASTLPVGILRHVSVEFPKGCNSKVFVVIGQGGAILYPTGSAGGTPHYTGDNLIIDFDTFQLIKATTTNFNSYGWNDGVNVYWNHVPIVRYYVEKMAVP
jgi:hypothetical protein